MFIYSCSETYQEFEEVSEKSFSIAILPDTQGYSKSYPQIFENQTQWLADNKTKLNLAGVVHLGDLVENAQIEEQWEIAEKSLSTLTKAGIPYLIAAGNHDYGIGDEKNTAEDRSTLLHEYFPPETFTAMETFQGFYPEEGRIDNSYQIFELNGMKWLILALEFGPRDEVLEWANFIVETNSEDYVVVATHAYLYFDNSRLNHTISGQKWNPHNYGIASKGDINDGQEMWDKFISKHSNIVSVISGHVLGDGVGQALSSGAGTVQEMLVNYQMQKLAGEGFMRILIIDTETNTIKARSYSPWIGKYKRGKDNEFDFYF